MMPLAALARHAFIEHCHHNLFVITARRFALVWVAFVAPLQVLRSGF
jgi:hypothetical protein